MSMEYKLPYTGEEITEKLKTIDDNTSTIGAVVENINNLQTILNNKAEIEHNHDDKYDTKGSAESSLSSAKSYTETKIAELSTTLNSHMENFNIHITVDEKSQIETNKTCIMELREEVNNLTNIFNGLVNGNEVEY